MRKTGGKARRVQMKNGRFSPWLRFAVLLLWAAVLQGIPILFSLPEGDRGMALYLLHLYAVIPLCALLVPFWAGLGGVHPLAACLPIGGALMLLPVYQSPGIGGLCILLSLIGCVAGQEWKKRKAGKKGGHHGGKRHP